MTKDQKDPEIILQDVLLDILDNKKYRSYTNTEEWQPFFSAMAKLTKQICKKSA
jgi:hypothetical protein